MEICYLICWQFSLPLWCSCFLLQMWLWISYLISRSRRSSIYSCTSVICFQIKMLIEKEMIEGSISPWLLHQGSCSLFKWNLTYGTYDLKKNKGTCFSFPFFICWKYAIIHYVSSGNSYKKKLFWVMGFYLKSFALDRSLASFFGVARKCLCHLECTSLQVYMHTIQKWIFLFAPWKKVTVKGTTLRRSGACVGKKVQEWPAVGKTAE